MSRRPVLIFDGDCGFCRLWIERWRAATGERVEYEPYQTAAARYPRVPRERFAEAVRLFEPDGRASLGAEAALRAIAYAPGASWLPRVYALPGFAPVAEAAYRFVAARRSLFSRLTRLLWGESPLPAPIERTARLALAGIGVCYLAAFVSLGVQVRGLIGADGIMPAAAMLSAAKAQLGASRFWAFPTLAWLSASDAALAGCCWLGGLASLGLIWGVAAGPCALACWALHLSLCAVGADFMSFQWDVLLLEAGLIACFLAPMRFSAGAPSRGALWLLRLLLFKLMLQSGLVKILSGDTAWRDLTALTYHYWTQPLPTPLAWWAGRLPLWAHKASCAAMFAVELGAPWLILAPRRARATGAAAIAALMLLIAATGNYGFFNLLAFVLCLACLDDRTIRRGSAASEIRWEAADRTIRRGSAASEIRWEAADRAIRGGSAASKVRGMAAGRTWAVGAFAALWLAISAVETAAILGVPPPTSARRLIAAVSPLRSINHYGLFAVMTKSRDEISLEVSADGRRWQEWPFLYKPGDPRRAPPLVAPHMPRLDWQMWFAALGRPSDSPWFGNLLYRVLQGSPSATRLLGPNPLGGAVPKYARAVLYETAFAAPDRAIRRGSAASEVRWGAAGRRRADGSWWRRERKGLFFPVVSLKP